MALTASSRGAYGDESPEALRRRADVLLDEMMLGGIDTGAAGPQTSGMVGGNGNGLTHWPSADEIALDYDGASYASTSNGPNGSYGDDVSDASVGPDGRVGDSGDAVPRAAGSRLISAEDRYAQLAGAQPGGEPAAVPPVEPALPNSGPVAGTAPATSQAPAASNLPRLLPIRTTTSPAGWATPALPSEAAWQARYWHCPAWAMRQCGANPHLWPAKWP